MKTKDKGVCHMSKPPNTRNIIIVGRHPKYSIIILLYLYLPKIYYNLLYRKKKLDNPNNIE